MPCLLSHKVVSLYIFLPAYYVCTCMLRLHLNVKLYVVCMLQGLCAARNVPTITAAMFCIPDDPISPYTCLASSINITYFHIRLCLQEKKYFIALFVLASYYEVKVQDDSNCKNEND